MNTVLYINTPLSKSEHDALAALAKREGRSKGKQLRELALKGLNARPRRKGARA